MKSPLSRIRQRGGDPAAETPGLQWNAVLWAGLMAVFAAGVLLMTFRNLDTRRLLRSLETGDG
jgi:hypothetical protein